MPESLPETKRNMRRYWRFRFSIRALVIMLMLVGLYFGSWELTKRCAVPARDVVIGPQWPDNVRESEHSWAVTSGDLIGDSESPLPFIVRTQEVTKAPESLKCERYYLWFFGYQAQIDEWWKLYF